MTKAPFYEPATLVDRLQGIYRIPIRDGLGAVGAGEEPDNPDQFVRKFDTSPIHHEAAKRIKQLEAALRTISTCEIEFNEGLPVGYGPPICSAEQAAEIARQALEPRQ